MCKRSAESTVQSHVRRAIEARRCGRRRLDAVSPDIASNVPFTPERHDKAHYRCQFRRARAASAPVNSSAHGINPGAAQ